MPGNLHPGMPLPYPRGNARCDVETGTTLAAAFEVKPKRGDQYCPTRIVVRPLPMSAKANLRRGTGCCSEKAPVPLKPPKKSISRAPPSFQSEVLLTFGPLNARVCLLLRTAPPENHLSFVNSGGIGHSAFWPLPKENV